MNTNKMAILTHKNNIGNLG